MVEGNRRDLKEMAARIIDLLEPELVADGFDLLDVRIFRGGGRLQLRIYVDLLEGGISLDQVAKASRTIGMLLEDDMAVTDVAHPFEMSLAAISKHLSVLTGAGLISQEKRGRVKWCKLEPDAMRAASVWMQGFGQFEPVNLEAFEIFLKHQLSEDNEKGA